MFFLMWHILYWRITNNFQAEVSRYVCLESRGRKRNTEMEYDAKTYRQQSWTDNGSKQNRIRMIWLVTIVFHIEWNEEFDAE